MASLSEEGDEDDAVFLSAIAEAEADGLRRLSQGGSKRQHAEPAESVSSSLPSSHGVGFGDSEHGYGDGGNSYRDKEAASKRSRAEPEGEYMAALRGTHSETWQAMSSKARLDAKARYGAASSSSRTANLGFDGAGAPGGSSGVCFHCGKDGHWAKDCPSRATMTSSPWGPDGSNTAGQVQVPHRDCPCGGGTCLVLTANTEKNPGRQFYRCPLRKEEGQCGFFEWCDGITNSTQGLSKEQGSSYVHSEFPCPCGAGSCVKLTAKTEKNMGRQFYRCPLNQGEGSCGFFKWCDESVPASGAPAPAYGGRAFGEKTSMLNVATGQCSKRGMDGHWAKDCSAAVQNASLKGYASTMQKTGPAGSSIATPCFKCGQVGHWANNCPNLQLGHGSKVAVGGINRQGFPNASGYGSPATGRDAGGVKSATSGGCFKCGSKDHWSNNCPNASNTGYSSYGGGTYSQAPPSSGRSGVSGSCYKCGGQGHYANECRADGKGQNMF